jgi:hypothetical protein
LIDLNEDIRFKPTGFLCILLKTWHLFGATNGLILSGYFLQQNVATCFQAAFWEDESSLPLQLSPERSKFCK